MHPRTILGCGVLALVVVIPFGCSAANGTTPPSSPTIDELRALSIPNASIPQPGLIASAQPSPDQIRALVDRGVTSLVSLRRADESGTGFEEALAADLGVRFVRLPITGATDLTVENARRFADALAGADGGSTLASCSSSNRVGAMLAMKAFHVDGRSADEALALGRAGGLRALEAATRERLVR